MIGLKKGEVRLQSHSPEWLSLGEAERLIVANALRDIALAVEHVGSTAVPGLDAKPILDIAVALRADGGDDEATIHARMTGTGYIDRGLAADGGGWLFVRELTADVRVVHVHLVAHGDPEWNRYLAFRDALRADPTLRDRYTELKHRLAAAHPGDRRAYTQAKTDFIRATVRHRER